MLGLTNSGQAGEEDDEEQLVSIPSAGLEVCRPVSRVDVCDTGDKPGSQEAEVAVG